MASVGAASKLETSSASSGSSSWPWSIEYRRWIVPITTLAVGSSTFELQVLDDVQLAELAPVVGRDELLELLLRLAAQVAAVDQEQDPLGLAELRQPIGEVGGRERLAGAGRHLDQGSRLVGGQ